MDVAIVGGGITGAGLCREAARRVLAPGAQAEDDDVGLEDLAPGHRRDRCRARARVNTP